MWGRQHEASSMYKRISSRDNTDIADVEDNSAPVQNNMDTEVTNPSWTLSLPHVAVATIASFLFGYHIGVVNEPLERISFDLGFNGHTLAEGLVVSTCLGGAFIGSMLSGWIADGVGRRRAFQLSALPMIIGASISATTTTLAGMLVGRFLVGTGLGLGPPVVALYVTEVSPAFVRGTYGSFIQIATCLGIMAALFIGIPVKEINGWWRICFWVSVIPAGILVIAMMYCAESPHWLYKQGRSAEAEIEFEKLLGGAYVKCAMQELSRVDRGDDTDSVTLSELLYGRHFRVVFIGSTLFALQQLSGVNAVFYFSSTVFKSAGVPPGLANIFIGVANLIGSLIAMALMDRLGRKVLLLWSFFGMGVCMSINVAGASSYMAGSGALFLSLGGMLIVWRQSAFRNKLIGWPSQTTGSSMRISSLSLRVKDWISTWRNMWFAKAIQLICYGMLIVTRSCLKESPTNAIGLMEAIYRLEKQFTVWIYVFLFVFTFALGAGPVPSLLLPEIFSNRIRAKAMAICLSVHWVINFFVGLLFLRLLEQLGPQILYTIFASFCMLAVVFVKRNVMETKGKSLQEIEIALLPQD